MAVTHGNRNDHIKNTVSPAWTTATWANSDSPSTPSMSGADFLLVHIVFAQNTTVNSVTHNGNSLTKHAHNWFSGLGQREEFWYMTNPDNDGDLVVTLNAQMFQGISLCMMGFSGVDQTTPIGNQTFNGGSASPHVRSRTVSEGSMVFVTGISTVSTDDITIDGTVTTGASGNLRPNQQNVNDIVSGMWSNSSHSAGSINTETDASSTTNITNSFIEILADGGGVGGGRRRIIIV
jgi:hypothetical protein